MSSDNITYNIIKILRGGIVNLHNKRYTVGVDDKIRLLLELIKVMYSCLALLTIDDDKSFSDLHSCYAMLDDLYGKSTPENSESVDAILMPELSVHNQSSDDDSVNSDIDTNGQIMNSLNRGIEPREAFRMMSDDKKRNDDNVDDNQLYNSTNKAPRRTLNRAVIEEYADELDMLKLS